MARALVSTQLDITYEWLTPDGNVAASELAATWARLEINAGDETITRVEDVVSGSARRSIYGSLYPLAEWIAYNWWSLRANLRLAGVNPRPAWMRDERWGKLSGHNLRFAGDGFLWPNLTIIPQGGSTRLVWLKDAASGRNRPIRYIAEGSALLSSESVESVLGELVDNVVIRLVEAGIDSSPMQDEWHAIRALEPDEVAFCAATARLGLDPFGLSDGERELIETVGNHLPASLLYDFLDGVEPNAIEPGVMWIKAAQKALGGFEAKLSDGVVAMRQELSGAEFAGRAWDIGWAQARRARSVLTIPDADPVDVEGLVPIINAHDRERGLIAFGGMTAGGGPAVVSAVDRGVTGQRFAVARAVWHLVNPGPERFLVTDAHTDRQKTERAFAAELLAPANGVRRLLEVDDGVISFEQLDPIAEHFGVSPLLISHQVENQLELEIQ
jgi:hypothetical protein